MVSRNLSRRTLYIDVLTDPYLMQNCTNSENGAKYNLNAACLYDGVLMKNDVAIVALQ